MINYIQSQGHYLHDHAELKVRLELYSIKDQMIIKILIWFKPCLIQTNKAMTQAVVCNKCIAVKVLTRV